MAELLRTNIANQVRRAVRMAVHVAIETGDAPMRLPAAAVLGGVELLLRERGNEQPQTLDLLRVQKAVEQFVEVIDRNQLALGNIAQIRAGCQKNRGRELGQDVIGQIEVEI